MAVLSSFNHSNVSVISRQKLVEIPFLRGIFRYLAGFPWFRDFRFIIADHRTPLEVLDRETIIIYLGNEDGRLPTYLQQAGLLFTPYPPPQPHPKVYSFPLGYHGAVPLLPVASMHKRQWDGCFSGRKIHRRKAALDSLDQLQKASDRPFYLYKTSCFAGGLAAEAYAQMLNNAKLAVAPEGNYSNITFRLFEAIRQGSIPITPPLPQTWFFQDFPGIQIADWAMLPGIVAEVLQDQAYLNSLQKQVLSYHEKYCSGQAVAGMMGRAIEAEFHS